MGTRAPAKWKRIKAEHRANKRAAVDAAVVAATGSAPPSASLAAFCDAAGLRRHTVADALRRAGHTKLTEASLRALFPSAHSAAVGGQPRPPSRFEDRHTIEPLAAALRACQAALKAAG